MTQSVHANQLCAKWRALIPPLFFCLVLLFFNKKKKNLIHSFILHFAVTYSELQKAKENGESEARRVTCSEEPKLVTKLGRTLLSIHGMSVLKNQIKSFKLKVPYSAKKNVYQCFLTFVPSLSV